MGQETSLWVREAAEFEVDGDTIICRWGETEWVMSPAVSMEVESRLARANAAWRAGQSAQIIKLSSRGPLFLKEDD